MDFRSVEAHEVSAQNPVQGDLMLDGAGDVVTLDGKDRIVANIRERFRMWRGESAFDLRLGFPWLEDVLVKGPDLGKIRALVTSTIATTAGVAEVNEVHLDHDRRARRLAIRFRARTTDDGVIDSGQYAPFALEPGRG